MKKLVSVLSLVALTVISISCKQNEEEIIHSNVVEDFNQKQGLNAVLWHQTSAEYKALCFQAYNLAKVQLDHKLEQHAYPYDLPPAIVMDLDETVIDNSYFNAQLIKDNRTFSKAAWKEWSDKVSATAVPGAIEFIKYAKEKGVTVIFISNRRTNELQNTKLNLEKLGLDNLDTNNFYFRVEEGSKKARREEVSKNHEIVMLFGDNLADFTELFDKKSVEKRNELVTDLQAKFGDAFIILPNALYGEWESSLFEYKYDYTEAQKDSIRMGMLQGL